MAVNYQSGQKIAFDLMVRSKANNVVKNKFRVSQLVASAAAAGQTLEHAADELCCNQFTDGHLPSVVAAAEQVVQEQRREEEEKKQAAPQ